MFSEIEQARLVELAQWYKKAKPIILYAEEADPDFRSNLQIIKELRDAFDHMMRVVVARADVESEHHDGEDYGEQNLHKALSHTYRASFDALDGTVLSIRQQLAEMLEPFDREVLNDVIPDYWKKKRMLDDLTQRIAGHRASKDVGSNVGKVLDAYMKDVKLLIDFKQQLTSAMPSLMDSQRRLRRSKWKGHIVTAIISLAVGAVGWWLRGKTGI